MIYGSFWVSLTSSTETKKFKFFLTFLTNFLPIIRKLYYLVLEKVIYYLSIYLTEKTVAYSLKIFEDIEFSQLASILEEAFCYPLGQIFWIILEYLALKYLGSNFLLTYCRKSREIVMCRENN